MDPNNEVMKGKLLNHIEPVMFLRRTGIQNGEKKEDSSNVPKILKPLPPASRIAAEAMEAKLERERKEKEAAKKEEEETEKLIKNCEEVERVHFQYGINLYELIDEMVNAGMGTELEKLLDEYFYPKYCKLVNNGNGMKAVDKKAHLGVILGSSIVNLAKDQLCSVLASSSLFKDISNLQWEGMKEYVGVDDVHDKVKELAKEMYELKKEIEKLKNDA
uniref:Uncharacterized protein n=1 Tax=Parastrongyloides trichosuri TaxID=131310 RepID=A0A0N4ZPN5_PARTI